MKAAILTGLAASLLAVPTIAGERVGEQVWQVGNAQAPFQRELVHVSAADAARMEIIKEAEQFWAMEFSDPPLSVGYRELSVTGAKSVQPELDTRSYTPIQSKSLFNNRPQ